MSALNDLIWMYLFGGSGGGGSVSSVNGKTGAVVLTAADLDDSFKDALLDCFANVAWATEDGQQYYDALEAELYPIGHITAVYTQSGTVYDTDSLDSLKAGLVVTAFYVDGKSKTVAAADYTLSGTFTVGTSTITVGYRGKTTTFTVTVSESSPYLYSLTENDFSRGVQVNTSSYPYYDSYSGANKRISYVAFDLLLSGGKTYKITATSTKATAQMAVRFFNQKFLNDFNNQVTANHQSDKYDPGWQNLAVEVAVPSEQNGSPIAGVRITFRESSANPDISENFAITALTIEEVAE